MIILSFSACTHIPTPNSEPKATPKNTFLLTSHDIAEKRQLNLKQVFNGFGCTGANLSPHLAWQNAPKDTKSFAITVYDPDAPTVSGWWHWLVVNIPHHVKQVAAGQTISSISNALETKNDYGSTAFGGACPPKGDKPHRYQVTVWALNTDKLPVSENSSGALVGYYLNKHKIATATITATYQH